MFTNVYCVVQSSAWIFNVVAHRPYGKNFDVVHRSAAFDILSRGADKKGLVVDMSKRIAHCFRPLVGDVIRPSHFRSPANADGADIEVKAYRWTGDEATTTKFKPVADVTLSLNYPRRGDGQGLGFGTDDKLLVLEDAFPELHPPIYRPTIKKSTRKKQRFGAGFYSETVKLNINKHDE